MKLLIYIYNEHKVTGLQGKNRCIKIMRMFNVFHLGIDRTIRKILAKYRKCKQHKNEMYLMNSYRTHFLQ